MATERTRFTVLLRLLNDRCRRSRYKIGFSADPEQRAKDEDRRIYGKIAGGPRFVELHQCWKFQSETSARFVEQSIIDMLARNEFKRTDINDWFEIDPEGLHFICSAAKRTIANTQRTEPDILLRSKARRRDKPYGKHIQQWLSSLNKATTL